MVAPSGEKKITSSTIIKILRGYFLCLQHQHIGANGQQHQ
jgi:hypothetical protein